MTRVDDYFPFRCGDTLREEGDWHVGDVVAVIRNTVRVKWRETGWKTDYVWPAETKTLMTVAKDGDVHSWW